MANLFVKKKLKMGFSWSLCMALVAACSVARAQQICGNLFSADSIIEQEINTLQTLQLHIQTAIDALQAIGNQDAKIDSDLRVAIQTDLTRINHLGLRLSETYLANILNLQGILTGAPKHFTLPTLEAPSLLVPDQFVHDQVVPSQSEVLGSGPSLDPKISADFSSAQLEAILEQLIERAGAGDFDEILVKEIRGFANRLLALNANRITPLIQSAFDAARKIDASQDRHWRTTFHLLDQPAKYDLGQISALGDIGIKHVSAEVVFYDLMKNDELAVRTTGIIFTVTIDPDDARVSELNEVAASFDEINFSKGNESAKLRRAQQVKTKLNKIIASRAKSEYTRVFTFTSARWQPGKPNDLSANIMNSANEHYVLPALEDIFVQVFRDQRARRSVPVRDGGSRFKR